MELTAAEKLKLETNHAQRLKEVASKHCPGIMKTVRTHKVPVDCSTSQQPSHATSLLKEFEQSFHHEFRALSECPACVQWAWPFNQPVDQARFKDYLRTIKEPMDLGTMQAKLDRWQYNSPQEFERDMRLVFENCRRYNAADQEVVVMGNTLEVCQTCSCTLLFSRVCIQNA